MFAIKLLFSYLCEEYIETGHLKDFNCCYLNVSTQSMQPNHPSGSDAKYLHMYACMSAENLKSYKRHMKQFLICTLIQILQRQTQTNHCHAKTKSTQPKATYLYILYIHSESNSQSIHYNGKTKFLLW